MEIGWNCFIDVWKIYIMGYQRWYILGIEFVIPLILKATKTIINSIVSKNDRIYVGIQLPPPKLTHNKGLLSGKIKHEAPPLSLGES